MDSSNCSKLGLRPVVVIIFGLSKTYVPVAGGYVEDVDVYVLAGFGLAAAALLAEVSAVFFELLTSFLVSAAHYKTDQ